MKKYLPFLILLGLAPLNCAFDWGFGAKDTCGEARKIVARLSEIAGADERDKVEMRVIQLCPEGAAGHFVSGLRKERAGDREGAIREYREAVKDDNGFSEARGALGLSLLQKGMIDEAAVELTRAAQEKSDPRYDRALARVFAEKKLYPLALYYHEEALRHFPEDAELHASAGEVNLMMGRLKSAEEEYKTALAADEQNLDTRLGLARVFLEQNEADRAIAELNKVEKKHHGNSKVLRLLGEAFERKGDRAKAEDAYRLAGVTETGGTSAVAKGEPAVSAERQEPAEVEGPTADELQKKGDELRAAGKDDDAIASYQEAVRQKGENGELYYNLGLLYEKKGLLDEAVVSYRQSLRFTPQNNGTRQKLADIYTARGSLQQAIEQYREMLRKEGTNADLHMKLAKVLISTKNLKEGLAECREVVRLDPNNLEGHRELAALFKKGNEPEEAVKHYREVLRLKKDDVEARNSLTAIYVKNKNYDELIDLLKESVELNPQDPNTHYKLGLVYEFKKDYDSAMARYRESIQLKADHAKSLNALGRVYMKTGHIEEAKEALEQAKKADPSLEETAVLLSNINDEFYQETKSTKYYNKKARKGKKSKKSKSKKSKSKKSKSKKK